MYVISKTLKSLHQTCLQQVKEQLENTKVVGKKHAFHESANFVILEPGSHMNPVSYDGKKFSHSIQDENFDKETDHYNELIKSIEVERLIQRLKSDQDSKKAYLSFWENKFVFGESGEVPCMVGVHFFTEEDRVFAVTQMRSNELLTLLPIDINFSIALQTYIANQMQMTSGSYTHQVASLILYTNDVNKL